MTEYDLKNINFNLNYFDIQISDRNLFFHEKLNKMRFYSKFLGGEREQKFRILKLIFENSYV